MCLGDLVWCVYHIYLLPKQGVVINIIKDYDIYYVVLIEDEMHTLAQEEVFLSESDALRYQIGILKENNRTPIR